MRVISCFLTFIVKQMRIFSHYFETYKRSYKEVVVCEFRFSSNN